MLTYARMWENLTSLSVTPLNLIIRALIVYVSILLLLRISGKREIGQMGAVEFVVVLLISNAVQNSMNAGDNSLLGGLISAAALIFISWGISWATFKNKHLRAVFEGTPTLLVNHGKVLDRNLHCERMTHEDLKTMLRKQGIHRFEEIQTAILESDGSLTVTKVTDKEVK